MSREPKKPVSSVERLLNLAAFLASERRPRTLREIIAGVEGYDPKADYDANRRKFIRDKEELEEIGIRIDSARAAHHLTGHDTEGYVLRHADVFLPRIALTEDEARALAAMGRAAAKSARGARLEALELALAKLDDAHGAPPADNFLVQLDDPADAPPEELLALLNTAVLDSRRIRMKYLGPADARDLPREVDPYGLFVRNGFWYLVGFCRLRKGARTFRVDRIRDAAPLTFGDAPDFETPPDFSIEDFIRSRAPWEFGDAKPHRVAARFAPDAFWRARNEWGNLREAAFDEKRSEASFVSVNDDAFLRWALTFGDDAEILRPPELRERAAKIIEETLRNVRPDATAPA